MIAWWPSLDDAIEAHDTAMRLDESPSHPVNPDKLEGAINRPQMHHYYNEITDVIELATLLAIAVAESHAFADGNKRTAYTVFVLFLDRNGVTLTIGRYDQSIAQWIERVVMAFQQGKKEGETMLVRFTSYVRTVTTRTN